MSVRPSSLPALSACPCFAPDQSAGVEDKGAGTARHEYLAALLTGGTLDVERLSLVIDGADAEGVQWAHDYIQVHAPASDYALHVEKHVNPMDASWEPIFSNGGTLDVCCGPELFDLKWRVRDYRAQMCAYALAMCQEDGWPSVRCHLLFAETRRAQVYTVTAEESLAEVERIVAEARKPLTERMPVPCDYCSWCSRLVECPAHLENAEKVATGYSDSPTNWHPSQMTDPKDLAAALRIWQTSIKKWGASLEYHALQAAKSGVNIPGYELRERKGKRMVNDLAGAFSACGLPQDEFLKACALRLNTSQKYPDQLGLVDIFRQFTGIDKKAAAERELLRRLANVISKPQSTQVLRAKNSDDDSED